MTLSSPFPRKTPYSKERAAFSESAHLAAQRIVYPQLFVAKSDDLTFENTNVSTGARGRILDGQMGIDRVISVTVRNLSAPLTFPVQERFRGPQFESKQDVTVTEWNFISNLPSELFKISAGFFVYGYYDESLRAFGEVVAIDVPYFLLRLAQGELKYGRGIKKNKRTGEKEQSFLTFKFDDLESAGALIFRLSRC